MAVLSDPFNLTYFFDNSCEQESITPLSFQYK